MLLKKDGWLVTRGVRAGRWDTNTHTHNYHQVTVALCTQTHTAVRGRRRSFTNQPLPSPGYHWHCFSLIRTHHPVSLIHIHTQLPGGSMLSMWPVENHYSAVQSKEPRVNFLFKRSVFLFSTAPPLKTVWTVAGSCSLWVLGNVSCVDWIGTTHKVWISSNSACVCPLVSQASFVFNS